MLRTVARPTHPSASSTSLSPVQDGPVQPTQTDQLTFYGLCVGASLLAAAVCLMLMPAPVSTASSKLRTVMCPPPDLE